MHKTLMTSRQATRLSGATAMALILAAGFSGSPALAQNDKGDGAIEEVVVTAEFRKENLQKTPISITAITADMMDARAYTRITDVTGQSPNVQLQLTPAGGGNTMRAFIRGVGQSDQSPSVDPGVGIYVDDVYFASLTGSVFDLVDLDRVEILRGPQGVLGGMNSLGGSVKLYSRKPTGEGGFIEGTYGSLNRTDVRASGDFTVVPDQLFLRVSGVTRNHDGYVRRLDYACVHPSDPDVISGAIPRGNSGPDCQIGTLGGQAMAAGKASLRWVPNDKLEVNLNADVTHDNSETRAATLLNAAEFLPNLSLAYQGTPYDNRYVPYGANRGDTVMNDPYITYANFASPGTTFTPIDPQGHAGAPNGAWALAPENTLRGWGFSGTVDYQINDMMSLKSITGYRGYDSVSTQDNDGSPSDQLLSRSVFTHEQFSQELRLSGVALDGALDYTVGAIYFHQKTIYESREHDPFIPFLNGDFNFYGPPIFDFIQNDTTINKAKAVFGHVIYSLTDRLNIAAGIRYTHQDKTYEFQRLNIDGVTPFQPLSDPANPLNGKIGEFKGSHTDYRLNASYQFADDVMGYVQYSTGFKGGGISPRPYFPQQVLGFGPEKLYAYEAGLKSRFLDKRVQFNASVFYNNYKDYQATPTQCVDADGNILPAPYNTPCGQYGNVADAKVKGFEAELNLYPVEGLMIDASLSYLDFKFKAPKIATSSVLEGSSAPGIGDWKWSIGVQYEARLNGNGTLTPRVDITHTPGYCGNLNCDPLVSNDSYNLVNGRLTYRSEDEDWSVAFEVTNLTDKVYYINKFTSSYTAGQPGMPREWSISVRRNF